MVGVLKTSKEEVEVGNEDWITESEGKLVEGEAEKNYCIEFNVEGKRDW